MSKTSMIAAGIAVLLLGHALAQQPMPLPAPQTADKMPPMTLRTRIALPGVYGRLDHYGWDSKRGILLVSALGNNTVEVIDSWKQVHTIAGLEHPQATVYIPGLDRIAVSSQSGKLRFYDAASYALTKTLDFGAGANTDNLRYDPAGKLIYVAYGERQSGALAMVDPATMERIQEFKLGSHPESFQLEQDGSRIFVNLPDQEAIGVIDRKTGAVTKWKIPGNINNHALALDEARHRLFTAALQPGRLTVIDTQSGGLVANLPSVLGVDDLWFDPSRKRIYAPGAGFIDVFQAEDPDRITAIAHVPVGAGAGTTSFHIKSPTPHMLYMSWPKMIPQGGPEALRVYGKHCTRLA